MIIAIDPGSTKLAVCTDGLTPGKVSFFDINLKGPYSPHSSWMAYEWTHDLISNLGERQGAVFLEAPVMVRNTQSTLKQAMVSGAVQAAVVASGLDVYLVPVTQWKKEVVGKGNASKDEVRAWAEAERKGLVGQSQDFVDAYCIYVYGLRMVKRSKSL